MVERDVNVKRLVLQLLEDSDPDRMTGAEQRALTTLVRMVWRWEAEDKA